MSLPALCSPCVKPLYPSRPAVSATFSMWWWCCCCPLLLPAAPSLRRGPASLQGREAQRGTQLVPVPASEGMLVSAVPSNHCPAQQPAIPALTVGGLANLLVLLRLLAALLVLQGSMAVALAAPFSECQRLQSCARHPGASIGMHHRQVAAAPQPSLTAAMASGGRHTPRLPTRTCPAVMSLLYVLCACGGMAALVCIEHDKRMEGCACCPDMSGCGSWPRLLAKHARQVPPHP